MVTIELQRKDVDNEILIKTITYRCFTETKDAGYGSQTKTSTDYSVKGLLNILGISHKYVRAGLMNVGTLLGILRYQYTEETTGEAINPHIVPKEFDEIRYHNRWYRINKIRPALSVHTKETDDIVAWEIEANDITGDETE